MNRFKLFPALALWMPVLTTLPARAQPPVDPGLAAEIAKIRAVDNHAHPVKVVPGAEAKDFEFDALPVDNLEPGSDPVRTRPDNPEAIDAWRGLFGYRYRDRAPEHLGELKRLKREKQEQKGDGYPAWVLDRLGVEIMLSNRVAMGRGLEAPRFRWVPFGDALMYPLDNTNLKKQSPDRALFFPLEERLLKRYLAESGYEAPPATLDEYLRKVVTPVLERQKRGGAVALKFEAAYLRSLDFGDPPRAEAAAVYAAGRSGAPAADEYKKLQDYIFRYIAAECGRLGLPVHLHSCAGAGSYFGVGGANPLLLEPVLNAPALRKTKFVLVHGGWPFTQAVTALLEKPNVYADFSAQTFVNYPRQTAAVIREWLEHVPEKVMFATDAYPYSEELSWEETGWLTAATGRRALGIALTGMLRDGEIDRARAVRLARMVLRENTMNLHGLK